MISQRLEEMIHNRNNQQKISIRMYKNLFKLKQTRTHTNNDQKVWMDKSQTANEHIKICSTSVGFREMKLTSSDWQETQMLVRNKR